MAPSAYFTFCDAHRAAAKAKIQRCCDGGKVSAAEVAKELGHIWKALTEEERQQYKEKAQQQGEAQAQANAEQGADRTEGSDDLKPATEDKHDMLPLSVVKRIVCFDGDVSRISRDALVATALATELFLQLLAVQGAAAARRSKRSTIRLDDFETVVKHNRRLVAAGLRDVAAAAAEMANEHAAAREALAATRKENKDPAAGSGSCVGASEIAAGGNYNMSADPGNMPESYMCIKKQQDADDKNRAQAGTHKKGRPPVASKQEKLQTQGARIDQYFSKTAAAAPPPASLIENS